MKISQMPSAAPLTGEELVPIVQDGVNKQVAAEMLQPPTVEKVLADIFAWTGSVSIPAGTWLNFATLPGIAKTIPAGAGITIEANAFKFPAKAGWAFVSLGTRISGSIGGPAGTPREWKFSNGAPMVRLSSVPRARKRSRVPISPTETITWPRTPTGPQIRSPLTGFRSACSTPAPKRLP